MKIRKEKECVERGQGGLNQVPAGSMGLRQSKKKKRKIVTKINPSELGRTIQIGLNTRHLVRNKRRRQDRQDEGGKNRIRSWPKAGNGHRVGGIST